MALISVIISVYNGEDTIVEAVESALQQTLSDLEVIVIDDGSTDATGDFLQKISDSRLKVFSYPNAGIAASRNRALSHASGQYIAPLDADDIWKPEKLEVQLEALQSSPDAAVAYCWSDCIDESGHWLRPGGHPNFTGYVLPNLLLSDILENGSNPLIEHQALIKVGKYDESLAAGQDWDMSIRLAANYNFVLVRQALVLYRVSTSSISTNINRLETATLKVIHRAFSRAPESLQNLKSQTVANIYKYLIFKALESFPERRRAFVSIRFLWHVIQNEPVFIKNFRLLFKVILRILAFLMFPPNTTQNLITEYKRTFNIAPLMMQIHTEYLPEK
jgi:glycosyltransferase involved in cell wall biosynthesis